MVTSAGWSYRGWEHYRQLTTARNPSSSSGLHGHNTYKYIHRHHIIYTHMYMYYVHMHVYTHIIYVCMCIHTQRKTKSQMERQEWWREVWHHRRQSRGVPSPSWATKCRRQKTPPTAESLWERLVLRSWVALLTKCLLKCYFWMTLSSQVNLGKICLCCCCFNNMLVFHHVSLL